MLSQDFIMEKLCSRESEEFPRGNYERSSHMPPHNEISRNCFHTLSFRFAHPFVTYHWSTNAEIMLRCLPIFVHVIRDYNITFLGHCGAIDTPLLQICFCLVCSGCKGQGRSSLLCSFLCLSDWYGLLRFTSAYNTCQRLGSQHGRLIIFPLTFSSSWRRLAMSGKCNVTGWLNMTLTWHMKRNIHQSL